MKATWLNFKNSYSFINQKDKNMYKHNLKKSGNNLSAWKLES